MPLYSTWFYERYFGTWGEEGGKGEERQNRELLMLDALLMLTSQTSIKQMYNLRLVLLLL